MVPELIEVTLPLGASEPIGSSYGSAAMVLDADMTVVWRGDNAYAYGAPDSTPTRADLTGVLLELLGLE